MFDSLGRKIVIGKDEFRGASVKYEQVTTAGKLEHFTYIEALYNINY